MFTYWFSMLKDMLDDVVAVLVLEQGLNVGQELIQDGGGLLQGAVLQDSLDDPAAVGVSREGEDLKMIRKHGSVYPSLTFVGIKS